MQSAVLWHLSQGGQHCPGHSEGAGVLPHPQQSAPGHEEPGELHFYCFGVLPAIKRLAAYGQSQLSANPCS